MLQGKEFAELVQLVTFVLLQQQHFQLVLVQLEAIAQPALLLPSLVLVEHTILIKRNQLSLTELAVIQDLIALGLV
jgi:hypothetical protein